MRAAAPDLSALFAALADPTRRGLLEILAEGPRSMTALAGRFSRSLPTIFGHLEVLVRAGLVRSWKQGRVRTFAAQPQALAIAEEWMTTQRRLWERRLDQLDAHLLTMEDHDDDR